MTTGLRGHDWLRKGGVVPALALLLLLAGCAAAIPEANPADLTADQIQNLVRRSYQYVAIYNVNNKFAHSQGGWNTCRADTALKDHTMKDIARPNNDTLYIGCMLDLTQEPIILDIPAFDSNYVSLMVTAYDHYVNIPMSTRQGDFDKPERVLFYSARTQGYDGRTVDGVDRQLETSGDFVSAIFRVMPHVHEPSRFARIKQQMQSVKLMTLSEHLGGAPKPRADTDLPAVGKTDVDVFATNLPEVMQFIMSHVTFDPADELDQGFLAAYAPLGIEPGKPYDPVVAKAFDGDRFREAADDLRQATLAMLSDPSTAKRYAPYQFQPKGRTNLETVLTMSIIGPIGVPREEAVYPPIGTADGQPASALQDYVIRMPAGQLPPARAFWSLTLYDTENGFFIPNERKKYSVGENGGMELDTDGGIAIYIAAEKPDGVPEENWLPINRKAEKLNVIMRIYDPDLERYDLWEPPVLEPIGQDPGV